MGDGTDSDDEIGPEGQEEHPNVASRTGGINESCLNLIRAVRSDREPASSSCAPVLPGSASAR